MPTIERLVDLLAGTYRWGLHPIKLFAALLAPVTIVWLADRRLRARRRSRRRMRGLGSCRAPTGADDDPLTCTPATPQSRSR